MRCWARVSENPQPSIFHRPTGSCRKPTNGEVHGRTLDLTAGARGGRHAKAGTVGGVFQKRAGAGRIGARRAVGLFPRLGRVLSSFAAADRRSGTSDQPYWLAN